MTVEPRERSAAPAYECPTCGEPVYVGVVHRCPDSDRGVALMEYQRRIALEQNTARSR